MSEKTIIPQAFVLAAGFAKRMRPLTDTLPKPLVKLNGKPLLGHILDALQAEGVERVVVNGHHSIDPLREYIAWASAQYKGVEIILSEENDILETGGGAVKALDYLDKTQPFYMVNGDAYWVNPAKETTLGAMRRLWNPQAMDMILLLQQADKMGLTQGVGDYNLQGGQCVRVMDRNGTHMFAGVRILDSRILDGYEVEKFSFLKVMDETEARFRLYGYDHQGEWYHISTPQDLEAVENTLFSKAS